jgi:aryl-alcohol dehydrogenase-like predicted oxidoreductase
MGLVSEQSLYNLTSRMIELEVIPTCQDFGLGLIPYSPLAGGLLGGVIKSNSSGRRTSTHAQERIAELYPKLEAYESFCEELNEKPADIALAWLLHNPSVTAPIIGPRTLEQLLGNLHALEIQLPADSLTKLNEIFPGPGGAAPEAYAW